MKEPKCSKFSDIMLCNEFKISVSTFLLLFAFSIYARTPDVIHELCFTAMFFSFVGDILLMDYRNVPSQFFKGKQGYVGLMFFALAHLFYILMFNKIADADRLMFVSKIIMLTFIFGAPVSMYELMCEDKPFVFNMFAYVYSGFLAFNLAYSSDCAMRLGGKYVFSMIGVVLFIISDFLILVRETSTDTPLIRKLIWVFYPLAQILIILNV